MTGIPLEEWDAVADLIETALDKPLAERRSYLRTACAGDAGRLAIAERLLTAAEASAGFMAEPAAVELGDLLREAAGATSSTRSAQAGERIGPYVVERELGRGGMAVVYQVRDGRLERDVALKLLAPALADDPEARRRLLAEARAASHLDHPNIASVLDIGETDDGRMWIAMPCYRGVTLREHIARCPLEVPDALRIATHIVSGLAVAHAHGIIHRDIKPANVMITEDGTAKILDFGIARLRGSQTVTRVGTTLGTVAYMSPEQTSGGSADERSDVWAVGVLLFEMLSGRQPFEGATDSAVIHGIRSDATPSLRRLGAVVPVGLLRVVERCLQKDPKRRFASMSELADALAEVGRTIEAGTRLPSASLIRSWRSARFAIAALAVLALLAVVKRPFGTGGQSTHPSASSLVILPFAPAVDDSLLERLGVELAITLARALDGAGDMRVHDPLSVLAAGVPPASLPLDAALAFARERGASGLVHGTIVRDGGGVRVDATLHRPDGERVAQALASGTVEDLSALTDRLAVELLRQVWRRGRAPVPNLAAITTRSIPALHAYLDGERAIVEGRFRDAPEAFERAIALDSTFWFAYWRLWYVLDWHGLPVDSAVRAAVGRNLAALPDADSALAATRLTADQLERHDLLREAARTFPNYWPAWFDYADWLVHNGPYLGFPLSDARAALEQVVSLNPDLVPAWEHFFWIAVRERDVLLTERIYTELDRLQLDSLRAPELRYDVMLYYAFLADLVRSHGEPDSARAAAGGALLARMRSRTPQENVSASLHMYGFHRAQLALLDRVLDHDPAPDIRAAYDYGRALSWAARGAWDSALVSAAQYAGAAQSAGRALLPARLAVVGALVGGMEPEAAFRELAVRAERARRFAASPAEHADILWLDGLSAFTRDDAAGLSVARAGLRRLAQTSGARTLERSLAALEAARTGRPAAAGDSLAALEIESARHARQFAFGRTQPFFSAVNRLLGARWLIDAGRLDMAETLLLFADATFPAELRPLADANHVLAPLALLERARAAEVRGRTDAMRRYTAEALERMDLADAWLRLSLPAVR